MSMQQTPLDWVAVGELVSAFVSSSGSTSSGAEGKPRSS